MNATQLVGLSLIWCAVFMCVYALGLKWIEKGR